MTLTRASAPAAVAQALSTLHCGRLQVDGPAGSSISRTAALPGPNAIFQVPDWQVAKRVLQLGEVRLASAYLDSELQAPDLCELLTLFALSPGFAPTPMRRIGLLLEHLVSRAKGLRAHNVHSQYDLDHRFYASWLDASLTYSSAWFAGDLSQSLEQAQDAKHERVLQWLDPAPDSVLLDVGCGWGSLARYAARTRRCRVRGVTLSRRQQDYAEARSKAIGLDGLTRFDACDYRDVTGRFDHVVSLEMYETLGERGWPTYFRTLAQRVPSAGKALLQCIVLAPHARTSYRARNDFIRRHIARNAALATEAELVRHAMHAGWEIYSIERFGGDYAHTLRCWRLRFLAQWPHIEGNGRDARFRRLWELYLAYCEAGFRAGVTDVVQIAMVRA